MEEKEVIKKKRTTTKKTEDAPKKTTKSKKEKEIKEKKETVKKETKKETKEEVKDKPKKSAKKETKTETKKETKIVLEKPNKDTKEEVKDKPKKSTKKEIKTETKKETKIVEEKPKKDTKEEVKDKPKKSAKKETKTETKKEAKIVLEKPKKEIKEEIKKDEKIEIIKDKEPVMLDTKSQKRLRTLSKIISIFATIGRVALMIVVPFIFIIMIAIPFLAKHLEINGNVVRFYDSSLTVNNGYVTVKTSDNKYITSEARRELTAIGDFLTNNSKGDIILLCEVALGFTAVIVIIGIYILMYLEKLFKNITYNDTPFTKDNTELIKKIGYAMITYAVVSIVFGILIGIFLPKLQFNGGLTFGIFEILIVFVIFYIFKYATNLQKETKSKIYK